jgi:hypothetical protein
MELLPHLGALESHHAEEEHAENAGDDLLLALFFFENVDVLLRHYGAPVADALLDGVPPVVVVSVVAGALVAAGGVAAGTDAGAAA